MVVLTLLIGRSTLRLLAKDSSSSSATAVYGCGDQVYESGRVMGRSRSS